MPQAQPPRRIKQAQAQLVHPPEVTISINQEEQETLRKELFFLIGALNGSYRAKVLTDFFNQITEKEEAVLSVKNFYELRNVLCVSQSSSKYGISDVFKKAVETLDTSAEEFLDSCQLIS